MTTPSGNPDYEAGYDAGYLHGQYSQMQAMTQFHKIFSCAISEPWSEELAQLRADLVAEEANEVIEALGVNNREHLAKELADLIYVTLGTALSLGIDPVKAFTVVHQSNLSKLDDGGHPVYREDGKVLKGPNYRPPNLVSAVRSVS